MVVQNWGCEPTFRGPRGNSTLDITFTSIGLARRLNAWRVDERETLSDHLLICYHLSDRQEGMAQERRRGGGSGTILAKETSSGK
jgi:hypothetical protein